ncbi:D-isomer specific 2-hydroxyacid dehydrogenase [Advenella faeciporci]|uniref:D-isomer specific 2-hydroxyacid dehydrogenase n=1 Tax=Advenella faeciporci TaxID=797535 RepID=A0A918JGU2_9BURK|nr:2-hydroxyacid dehydrogenase [Advenella faeciporci]GGW80329.1 D-isomer specific 2-hydroxyacid dehydrogenase [Advenella faeciporci]
MTKHRVLQVGPAPELVSRHLENNYDVFRLWEQESALEALKAHGLGCVAAVTSAKYGFRNEWLDYLPQLKVLSSFGVGYDSIDAAELQRRGIQLGNTPDVLNDCVADTAMTLLLGAARGLVRADRFVREGQWPRAEFPLMRSITGKKAGILGLGNIGQAIAKRLTGFDCEIRYHNRSEKKGVPYRYVSTLKELAQWSDFLFVMCVGGPATYHLINDEIMTALGPDGLLINVSRGTVVDEEAMIKALREGRLGGAALDVFEREPYVPEALMEMDNVVLMPHLGSATVETRQRMSQRVIDNLDAFFREGSVLSRVV